MLTVNFLSFNLVQCPTRWNCRHRHCDEPDLTDFTVLCCIMERFGTKCKLCWFLVGPQDVAGHAACAHGAGSTGAEWSWTDSMPGGAQAYRVGSRYDGIPHRSCCGKSSMSFGLKQFLCEDSCCPWDVTLCHWVNGFRNFETTVWFPKMTGVLPSYMVPGSVTPLPTTSQPRRPDFSEMSLL